ncbi:ATP-binding protein [Methylibium sp.]|uniref:ATP-binding protein n=1 Tax=Methylibium sp. TaxID=2067992 RepID=UPI00286A1385|nr:ATP-binding protein [Methylibium sp.]
MQHFPRSELARQTAAAMQGKTLFGDGPNGLFLAAPRRTGKSTFLQSDLKPELESRDVVVVYVDLWADQKRDPGDLIADAVSKVVTRNLGLVARTAKAAGVESVSLAGWMKVDTSRIGKPEGVTLTDALGMLHEMTKKPVALIVDEAQHALTSEAGENAMTALKAARDRLNTPDTARLMLVMSGSDRDKLLRLVNTNGAPFYGSQVQRMPELGKDFVDFVADLIESQRPDLKPVNAVVLTDAFQRFGARPQFFSTALGNALNPLTSAGGRFEEQVLAAARQQLEDDEAQMESEYMSLKPIEQAVLWRLLELGTRFRPYDAEALKFYREKVSAASGAQVKVTPQMAQAALEGMRSRSPALVWKSARGEYAVDDAMMHNWFASRVDAATWPPKAQAE